MKALVIGGSGHIGSCFVKKLQDQGYEVMYTYYNNPLPIERSELRRLDITDRQAVISIIEEVNPDTVLHTAAIPDVDKCETDKNLANQVNIAGVENVIEGVNRTSSRATIIYISTAYVFDGSNKLYREEDEPRPINYYGYTKLEAERRIVISGLPFLVIRTDQLYGWTNAKQKKNMVTRTLEKLGAGQSVEAATDAYNNPTIVENCVDVTTKLLQKGKNGVYHVAGPDFLNRYEWAAKIAKRFTFDQSLVKPTTLSKLGLPARRPNCNISSEKAERDSGLRLLGVEEGLTYMLKNLPEEWKQKGLIQSN